MIQLRVCAKFFRAFNEINASKIHFLVIKFRKWWLFLLRYHLHLLDQCSYIIEHTPDTIYLKHTLSHSSNSFPQWHGNTCLLKKIQHILAVIHHEKIASKHEDTNHTCNVSLYISDETNIETWYSISSCTSLNRPPATISLRVFDTSIAGIFAWDKTWDKENFICLFAFPTRIIFCVVFLSTFSNWCIRFLFVIKYVDA